MKYSYSDWNNKKGTIPVIWNKEHYVNSGWYKHPDTVQGFSTENKNYQIYGDNVGVYFPKQLDTIFEQTFNFFDLDNLVFNLGRHKPGMILPWHYDNYPVYSKNKQVKDLETVVRIIVLLHDSQPGHQLWIEDNFCSGPAGSWFSWQGQVKHMAANLGEVDRYVLQITGTVK